MGTQIIDRGRGPEIAGTRITVYDVLHYAQAGWHHTGIAAVLGLCTEQVLVALRYIEENEAEVRAENQKILQRIARGNPPEVEAKLGAARAKLQALLDGRRQPDTQHEVNDAGDPGGR